MEYSKMQLRDLALEIQKDWKNPNYAAKPYINAISSMGSVNEMYFLDRGQTVVAYFLSNAGAWRGPIAKAIKNELRKRIKS